MNTTNQITIDYEYSLECYVCKSALLPWVAFTGYGETEDKARDDFFIKASNMSTPSNAIASAKNIA